MKISEIITDKYKLRIEPNVYYDLLADVREAEEKQELCEDAISREAVIDLLENTNNGWIINKILQLPPVNPKKPKTGHWIKEKTLHGWDGNSYQCSECGRSIHLDLQVEDLNDYPYCHCGAKMEESEVQDDAIQSEA